MPTINGLDVKREIADKRPKSINGVVAVLSGFARSCLSLERRGGGGLRLCLDCQTEFVREYIAKLMNEAFGADAMDGDRNALVYDDCERLLSELKITDDNGDFIDGIPDAFCRSSHYARGVFLGCGSMSAPQAEGVRSQKSVGYHLEFSFNSDSLADGFAELLGGYGIEAHKSTRAEKNVIYVKDSESVSDCLALIGADKAVLRLNEAVAALAVKRDVVRRMNCEIANMARTVNAAVGITDAIALIDKKRGLASLNKKLYEAATARLDDADASLSEIAERLGISKSGLKHRFDKIIEIAGSIDGEKPDTEGQ